MMELNNNNNNNNNTTTIFIVLSSQQSYCECESSLGSRDEDRNGATWPPTFVQSDVNKDLSHKDQDQDQDLTVNDQDKDKDLSRNVSLIAICSLIVSHQRTAVQNFRLITNSL